MKSTNLVILFLIVLIGVLGFLIYQQQQVPTEQLIEPTKPAVPTEPIKKPIIHYPVPEQEKPAPPPPTEANTPEPAPVKEQPVAPPQPPPATVEEGLQKLITDINLFSLLNLDNFIQRFVALIDNLPEKRLPRTGLPIIPPGGRFIVSGTDDAPQTSPRNHARYQRYVALLENINPDLAIDLYIRFYPTFQKAYEQLGYKTAYFNDRLVYTIDHLLETPDPKEPIALTQPSVLYLYADPLLEQRSAGQKLLIRIGGENRSHVKEVLKVYQQRLRSLHP